MSPKQAKRKAHPSSTESSPRAGKRGQTDGADSGPSMNGTSKVSQPHENAKQTEEFGIVLREFYPPEMSNARCLAYNDGTLERPIETLNKAFQETADARKKIEVKNAVVHWFKCDLRLKDNRSLHMAYGLAQKHNVPLICVYVLSPQDLTAHLCSPARVDFTLRTLQVLKEDLDRSDIPLYVATVEKRRDVPRRVVELCQGWGASHIFANLEYEVDELRRESRLVKQCVDNGIALETVHDTCVVPPGSLASQSGKQYAVYTPWFKAWLAFLKSHPQNLEVLDRPGKNPGNARQDFKDLFDCNVPAAPANKQVSEEVKKHFKTLYPEGEHEAISRFHRFLEKKAKEYGDMRNFPAADSTSVLSPYFASGALSARTAVASVRDANNGRLDSGNAGYANWISEVAWRDFYKHVLVHWPFICMNKCFKPEYTNIEWEYDQDGFNAWCEGKTGFPMVDAAMRQLKHDAWVHNRPRMVVASFLSKDLMIDWRRGERFFMENLIDGDFASNHGGWGFGSSTGVDPQPYFRIFNPLLQSERFDGDGDYIRHWVPELRDIKGKAIHDPYGRGAAAVAQENKYPKPIVEHPASRDRALDRYRAGLGRETA